MKILKKILKIIGILILLILLLLASYIWFSGPSIPKEAEIVIDSVINHEIPLIVKGDTGFAISQGHKIWYESISPKDSSKGAILLIMGISNDALGWPAKFIDAFVGRGYQVIRFDHRGTGLSDWLEDWDSKKAYSLSDMAADGVAILDSLGLDKANIVGISMGGMIAQEMAIDYPERVRSLISFMSTGYAEDPDLPPISAKVALDLIKAALKYGLTGGEKNIIKLHVASHIILRGDADYQLDIKEISEQVLYNLRMRRGFNMKVSQQHQKAVKLSGSRYEKLKLLKMATLIIHGKSDPFIPIEHGKKCASLIPGADSLWIDNMAHDIPDIFIDTVVNAITYKIETIK